MTNPQRDPGQPAGVAPSAPNTEHDDVPPDTGIGTRGKGRDADEDVVDRDEEAAVRRGDIATEPASEGRPGR